MWLDPLVDITLRAGRKIEQCESCAMRWLVWLLDAAFGLILLTADGVGWCWRKLMGYCPTCNPLCMDRVDGMGDDPDTELWQCRRCGRLHERWNFESFDHGE